MGSAMSTFLSVMAALVSCSPLRARRISMKWLDSSVAVKIPCPPERAFQLYSSFDQHPTWSPWLNSVTYDRNTGLSQWTIKSLGLSFSWTANSTYIEPPNVIQWESITGLRNRGRVEFSSISSEETEAPSEEAENVSRALTKVSMTISYDLPDYAFNVINKLGIGADKFIQNTLLDDLGRFRRRVLVEIMQENIETYRSSASPAP